jgi:hypothetical protein
VSWPKGIGDAYDGTARFQVSIDRRVTLGQLEFIGDVDIRGVTAVVEPLHDRRARAGGPNPPLIEPPHTHPHFDQPWLRLLEAACTATSSPLCSLACLST